MDLNMYEWMNGFTARHDVIEGMFRFVAAGEEVLFLFLLAFLFFAGGKWRSQSGRHGVAAAALSALLALGIAHLISSLWDRPRPYEAHPGDAHLLLSPSPDPSFPSDHTTVAYAIAVAILLRHCKAGIVALILATAVSVSRVTLGMHYPADVLGGAALGTLGALVLWIPSIRRPLHRLADWAGSLYDRAIDALSRPERWRGPREALSSRSDVDE